MEFNFPSLADSDKIGYKLDTMAYHQHVQVDECCLSFDTYGDGMTMHSNPWPIPSERAADFFASLAAHLLEQPDHCDGIGYKLRQDVATVQIEFASTVIYKAPPEGKWAKPRYYSMSDRKITSNENKRYDKRYEEIPSWADGKPEAIVRLMYQSYYSPLQVYALNNAVGDWCCEREGRGWMDLPTLGDMKGRHDEVYSLHSAWRLLQAVLCHVEGLRIAKGNVESWKSNLEYKRENPPKEEEKNAA